MTFDFDTSGAVQHPTRELPYRWSDLSPFAQGYIRAAFADYQARVHGDANAGLAFSDLHPDTLASMLADCAAFQSRHPGHDTASHGRALWESRQRGALPHLPPLRLSLDHNGKVIAHV